MSDSYTRQYSQDYNWLRKVTRNGVHVASVYLSTKVTGSRTGESVKDYKEKIKAGQQAGSPYTLDRNFVLGVEEGRATYGATEKYVGALPRPPSWNPNTYRETWQGMQNIPVPVLSHLSVSPSKAEAIALAKTYKKIREEQQHMNSPAVIAEFVDVLRQFGSPARALVDLTNRRFNRLELERRRLKGSTTFKRIKWSEIVASTYLEWSFGLAPLISDTRSAAEALARWQYEKTDNPHFRAKIVSRGEDVAIQKATDPGVKAWNSAYMYYKRAYIKKTAARCQYVVGLNGSLRADFGSNERLLQLLGFDHKNWIPALWEAVPWSWLVDYFTNVQQILEAAATGQAAVSWIVKTATTRSEYLETNDIDGHLTALDAKNNNRYGSASGHFGRYKQVRVTQVRTLPTTLGVPPLYFEIPSQLGQLANMTALLFSRRPGQSALWLF